MTKDERAKSSSRNRHPRPDEMLGEIFGRLMVLESERRRGGRQSVWWVRCVCTCGTQRWFRWSNVVGGYAQSCGCLRLQRLADARSARSASRHESIINTAKCHPEWTLDQIGEEHGVTKQRVQQVIAKELGPDYARNRQLDRRKIVSDRLSAILLLELKIKTLEAELSEARLAAGGAHDP